MATLKQGTLAEGEGSVQLTSLYYRSAAFEMANVNLFTKRYLSKEVNRTEPSLSFSIPWLERF